MKLIWWWILRPFALRKIRRGCTRYDCDTCRLFKGCPKWGRPKRPGRANPARYYGTF